MANYGQLHVIRNRRNEVVFLLRDYAEAIELLEANGFSIVNFDSGTRGGYITDRKSRHRLAQPYPIATIGVVYHGSVVSIFDKIPEARPGAERLATVLGAPADIFWSGHEGLQPSDSDGLAGA